MKLIPIFDSLTVFYIYMKALYYDCFSGISGDMNLAALLDLGVPKEYLIEELNKLPLKGYEVQVSKTNSHGIHGIQVKVVTPEHHEHHRNLKIITELIEQSTLSETIKGHALKMFNILGNAEAKVHGQAIDEIHFHEVGAVDSIIDIVGAAICIDYLKPEKIFSSSVEVGSGFVKCAHGILPVPAPATAELLENIPVNSGNQPFESTTPTGAVILASYVNEFTQLENFRIEKTAYGIGHRKAEIPNVLRVYWGEVSEKQATTHLMFECNIDDMNPEVLENVMDNLFKSGANDVFITPIIMKKTRNGSKLSVLCKSDIKDKVSKILIHETSTFGFRSFPVEKYELERDFLDLETRFGKVKVKRAFANDQVIKRKPEYADCVRISREQNVPLLEVYKEIEKALNLIHD